MSVSAVKIGDAFVEISARDQKFRDDLAANRQRVAGFVRNVAKIGAVLAVAGAAASLRQFADFGDTMDKMSARTGVTVENLSALKFASEQSGASIEKLEAGWKRMATTILDAERGTATALDTFKRLGVSLEDLRGLTPDQQFEVFAEAIAGIQDPSTQAALSMKVFGRAGSDLLPLLQQGTDGMAALKQEAAELGIVMSEEDAKAAAELTDAWNRLTRSLEGLINKVGAELAPMMSEVLDIVTGVVAFTNEWGDVIVPLAVNLTAVATAVGAVSVALALFARRAAIAQALSGPAGWIALAGSAVALGVALGTVDKALADHSSALDRQKDSLGGANSALDGLTAKEMAKQKAIDEQTAAYDRQTAAIINNARSQRDLDARFARRARIAAQESEYADTLEEVTKLQEGQTTSAEKLAEQLEEINKLERIAARIERRTGRETEGLSPDELQQIRDRLIDTATGFGREIQRVRDDIGLINGSLTETDIKLRELSEKGVPDEKIDELRIALEKLNEVEVGQQFDDAIAQLNQEIDLLNGKIDETDVKLAELGKDGFSTEQLDTFKRKLEELKQARENNRREEAQEGRKQQLLNEINGPAPTDTFQQTLDDLRELLREGLITREQAETKALEKQREAIDDARSRNADAARNVNRESSVDVRSAQGASLIVDALNGRQRVEDRIAANTASTAKAAQELADNDRDRKSKTLGG